MAGTQHFSPGDIQFQLVYDRGQCAESSYLKMLVKNTGLSQCHRKPYSAQFSVY